MSLKGKIERFLIPASVAGVEVILENDGKTSFHLVVLKKEKGKIVTELQAENILSLAELKKKIAASTPVCIVINGKGIIHKKITAGENDTDKSLLQKALSGAVPADFYVQKVKAIGNDFFISVVRSSQANQILEDFKKEKIDVLNFSLGPFAVCSLLPFLQEQSDYRELRFMQHSLVINAGNIEAYTTTEEKSSPIKVGDETVPAVFVNAFAGAFSGMLGNFSIAASIPEVISAREELREKKTFQLAGMASLAFFLIILLVNFFVFDHYWKKKQELELTVAANSGALESYEKLKSEFDEKKSFAESSGLTGGSKVSWYADRIAMDIPPAIQLTGMNIYPLEKKNNSGQEKISFQQKKVRIAGNSTSSTELNSWMNLLKKKEFVSEVVLANYTQEKEKKTGSFLLEIKLK